MVVVAVWPLLGCLLFNTVASSVLPRGQDDSGGHNWIGHIKVVALTQKASPGVDGQLELRLAPSCTWREVAIHTRPQMPAETSGKQ